jgi:hypothetical protein
VWENVEEPSMEYAKTQGWHDSKTTVTVLNMPLDKIWTVKYNNFEEKMTKNYKAILKIITTEQNNIALTDDLDKIA